MIIRDLCFHMRKLPKTIRILAALFMARTFGEYLHTVNDPSGMKYAKYKWKGKLWAFPSQPQLDH